MAKKRDAIEVIISLYEGLSPFDRGRLAQAMRMLDGGVKPEPVKKLGRPVGSKNGSGKNASKTNGAADESILGFQLGDGPA